MRLFNERSLGEAVKAALLSTLGALTLFAFMIVALPSPAASADIYSGPYEAEALRVVDADTIEVAVKLWPGQTVTVMVRVDGIDTPETWRPECQAEKAMGRKAKAFVEARIKPGDTLELTDVFLGKFAGRVVATVSRPTRDEPRSIAADLIEAGLAVSYDGGTKRDWCAGG